MPRAPSASPPSRRSIRPGCNSSGVCAKYAGFFPERFEEACLIEVQELVDCVLQNKAPGVSAYDGTKSTAIGCAATEAWKTGKIVTIQ